MIKEFYCNSVSVQKDEIILRCGKENISICLEECAENYAKEKKSKHSKCVADRNVMNLSFVFYSNPKIIIFFKKKGFRNMFLNRRAYNLFRNLHKSIEALGFKSYDMS